MILGIIVGVILIIVSIIEFVRGYREDNPFITMGAGWYGMIGLAIFLFSIDVINLCGFSLYE